MLLGVSLARRHGPLSWAQAGRVSVDSKVMAAEALQEPLQQRIDALTGQLNPALVRRRGGDFALMLSLIQQAGEVARSRASSLQPSSSPQQSVPPSLAPEQDPRYTPALVERLAQALQSGRRGEMALLKAWLAEPPPATAVADRRLSKAYGLLDEIGASSHSVAA